MTRAVETCFHEAGPLAPLVRRSVVEGVGTFLLVVATCSAGIAAVHLFPGFPGAALAMIACTVSGVLVSLIVAFGKISGGHYNPLITILQFLARERPLGCTLAYVSSQLVGGLGGGLAAATLWNAPIGLGGGLGIHGLVSEGGAAAGLMLVVLGASRSEQLQTGPFAVGAWLTGAILATPTNSYANPAVVLGAMVTAGPLALGFGSGVSYALAELTGALIALAVISAIYPRRDPQT